MGSLTPRMQRLLDEIVAVDGRACLPKQVLAEAIIEWRYDADEASFASLLHVWAGLAKRGRSHLGEQLHELLRVFRAACERLEHEAGAGKHRSRIADRPLILLGNDAQLERVSVGIRAGDGRRAKVPKETKHRGGA
jgi:hypothetical protein